MQVLLKGEYARRVPIQVAADVNTAVDASVLHIDDRYTCMGGGAVPCPPCPTSCPLPAPHPTPHTPGTSMVPDTLAVAPHTPHP